MLLDMAAEMIEKLQKEYEKATPAEKEHFIKSSLSLLQMVTQDTKDSIK